MTALRTPLWFCVLLAYSGPGALAGQGSGGAAIISGRIVDHDDGKGLVATVYAFPVESAEEREARLAEGKYVTLPALTVTTSSDGAFELRLPDREHSWRLDAVASGHSRATLAPCEGPHDVRLSATGLGPGGKLSGRVVDRDGKPVAGAVPRLEKKWGPEGIAAVTGRDGRFSLEGVPMDGSTLTVRASGYAPFRADGWGPKEGTTVTLQPGSRVAGRVVDEAGKGIAGIPVLAKDDPGGRHAISAPDGTFEVGDLAAGPIELTTRSDRYLPGSWKGSSPGSTPCVLKLARAGVVEVTVIDSVTRVPLPNASIRGPGGRDARTDASGIAIVGGLEHGTVTVEVSDQRHAAEKRAVLVEEGATAKLSVELVPGGVIEGVVTDEDGKPLAFATVEPGALFAMMGETEFYAIAPGSETSEDGRFRLEGIPDRSSFVKNAPGHFAGAFLLRAFHPTHARKDVPLPEITPGVVVRAVRVVLEQGGVLAGRVLDDEKRPLAGVKVSAAPPRRFGALKPFDEGRTDAAGRFELTGIPAGKVKIKADATGFLDSDETVVDVTKAARVAVPDISLTRAAVIVGVVHNQRGAPVEARVSRGGYDEARSDATGHFSLTVEAPQLDRDVIVQASGYAQWRRPVALGSTAPLEVILEDEHRLRGVVTSGADGVPVSTYAVEVVPARIKSGEDIVRENVSDAEGRFDVGGLPGGKVFLTIRAQGYLDANVPAIDLDATTGSPVAVALDRGLALEGTVMDADGKPRSGVRVNARDEEPSSWDVKTMGSDAGTLSRDDGSFTLDVVRPGKLWLIAMAEGHPNTVREFDVDATTRQLDLVLETGATVTGRVVDESGAPVRATVSFGRPMVPMDFMFGRTTVTQSDGTFAFRGVEAGPYAMQAKGDDGRSSEVVRLEVGKNDPPATILSLDPERGIRLEVTLTGLDDAALARASLSISGDRTHEPVRTGSDTFTFEGLEPGDVRIFASLGDRSVTKTFVVPDSQPIVRVTFPIPPGFRLSGRITKKGTAVDGVELWIESSGSEGVALDGESGADGTYALEGLADGSYRLGVQPDGGVPAAFSNLQYPVVIAGNTTLDIELPSGFLEGQVLDAATDAAIEGARVVLMPADGRSFDSMAGGATTDGTGRFRIEDVGDGTFLAWAFMKGHANASVDVTLPRGEPLPIRLEAEAALRIHMLDRRTGEQPADPGAMLLDANGRLAGFLDLEREGDAFKVLGAPRGTISMLVIASDAAPVTLTNVAVPGTVRVELGPGGKLEVQTPTAASIEVRRTDGAPGYSSGFRELAFRFDIQPPSLVLDALAPGDYRILVAGSPGREVRASIRDQETTVVSLGR